VAERSPTLKVPHKGIVTASLMTATTMQSLDMTIVNVALPHIQGSISATQEQMSWVLTSYIIAVAVMMPMTGWLNARFGRKRLYLVCLLGFTASSILCGIAQSIEQIVVFRILQGLSGAAIVPLSQAILLDVNPPQRHARAMAIWTAGITLAPIMGPTLGAWLTESYTWRWCFFVNVPVGLASLIGISTFLQDSPHQPISFDKIGFATLGIAIFSLQLALDRGPMKGWLDSTEICIEFTVAALAAYLFFVHAASCRRPFIDLHMFKDRNFLIGSAIIFATGVPMFAPFALTPSMLQELLNYPVMTAGLVTAPRGFGMLLGTMLLSPLLRYCDPRAVIAMGFSVSAVSLFQMSRFFLQMSPEQVVIANFVQGIGNGIAFVPLATLTFGSLPLRYRTDGTAAYNLLRNLGGSIGIAVAQVFYVHNSQVMHARLAEHVTPYASHHHHLDLSKSALLALEHRVNEQAAMLAYVNDFKMMVYVVLGCMPLVLLLRKVTAQDRAAVAAE
jgi:DHA2 family multidrug resistance protein